MPDWSYQTVFRPVLFRMPFERARDLCLGFMGRLARIPGGPLVIDLLGHMAPDPRLKRQLGEREVASPIGLAAGIDANHIATAALSRFGFGFVEVGPIAQSSTSAGAGVQLSATDESLFFANGLTVLDFDAFAGAGVKSDSRIQLLLRLRLPAEELNDDTSGWLARTVLAVPEVSGGVVIEFDGTVDTLPEQSVFESIRDIIQRESSPDRPVFLRVNVGEDNERLNAAAACVRDSGWSGLIIDAAEVDPASGSIRLGCQNTERLRETVSALRRACGDKMALLTSGGVHEPADALALIDHGADGVLIDSGLVFGGPGLAKRTNEALLARLPKEQPSVSEAPLASRHSWFWALLLSLALLGGGLLALVIASTRVVLPYDETLVGMTIDELCGVNENLLPFLTHDRVTLSGTMLADGILYFGLALWGIRAGFHWARMTVLASSMVGFFSFFLFLGFGYFDPFHAFVTAVVFQFVLFTMYAECRATPDIPCPDLHNDRAWRLGLLGQLVFLMHGAAITIGGLVICSYGVTTVFVQDDLDFMRTTADTLRAANPQLVPMIAHDRASFGGMLVSCGVATFLCALWGFRRGTAWLWWSLLLAGTVAYSATIIVHMAVGYTSLRHLLPAYGGLAALVIGSALTARWMLARPESPSELSMPVESP